MVMPRMITMEFLPTEVATKLIVKETGEKNKESTEEYRYTTRFSQLTYKKKCMKVSKEN